MIGRFLLLAFAVVLISCESIPMRSNSLDGQGRPVWVGLGNGPMLAKQGRLFQGVAHAPLKGMLASQTTIANKKARTALDRVVESYLQVVSRDFIASEQGQALGYQHYTAQRDIRMIVQNSRYAMRVVGHWQDRDSNRLYAVAELKSVSLKRGLDKLRQLNPGFREFLLNRSDSIFDRMAGRLP